MGTVFKLTSIITTIVGVQLIALEIACASSCCHTNATTNLTVALAADSQTLPKMSLSAKCKRVYHPPDTGGPIFSQGSATR